jgi:3-methyladenine DNA glycosylase AlkD
MQAYMKSAMPYLGVPTPQLRAACRETFARHVLPDARAWQAAMRTLWRDAEYREERYTAIELAGHKPYQAFETLAVLPWYEEMITTGAWWDYVDVLAIQRVGRLLRLHGPEMTRHIRAWAHDDDIWKRRAAILCQLSFKQATDVPLLHACIEPSIEREEFFLRKAIGWALREYSKTDPQAVIRYVQVHRRQLSPLSKREALKVVVKAGRIDRVP